MTSLLQAAADDVREAASYTPKEPMPMSEKDTRGGPYGRKKTVRTEHEEMMERNLAITAPEPGPQRDYEAEIAILNADLGILTEQIAELQAAYTILDGIKREAINDRRDAEQRAETLERALRLALDTLDAKEAGL